MGKKEIGFACGAFEYLHVGHLDLLKRAKRRCRKLVVGVFADGVLPLMDRMDVVGSLRCVDMVMPLYDRDAVAACGKVGATVFFTGEAEYGAEWVAREKDFAAAGVEVVRFPSAASAAGREIAAAFAEFDEAAVGDEPWGRGFQPRR